MSEAIEAQTKQQQAQTFNLNQLTLKQSPTLTATFSIVSPMFLGGADQKQLDGIRPASVIGALRFWWRALQWQKVSEGKTEQEALKHLHQEERRLFGSAAEEDKKKKQIGGQGVFVLDISHQKLSKDKVRFLPYSGLAYLLGQGLATYKKDRVRKAYTPNQVFDIKINFKSGISSEDIRSVKQALELFGLIGAMGSRSRHGWGSVAITALDGIAVSHSAETYQNKIHELLGAPLHSLQSTYIDNTKLPPYTAITNLVRYDLSKPFLNIQTKNGDFGRVGDPIDKEKDGLLDTLGFGLGRYRSYGNNDNVFTDEKNYFGKWQGKALQLFEFDHHNVFNVATEGPYKKILPKRTIFGLPHNYYFSKEKKSVFIPNKSNKTQRRSSPLFFHVHPVQDGSAVKYCLLRMLIPAEFLPKNSKTQVSGSREKFSFTPNWKVILDYLKIPLDQHIERKDF